MRGSPYTSPLSKSYASKDVTIAFRRFADLMGYANSKYRDAFIQRMSVSHSFLHKFDVINKESNFVWSNNHDALIERDKTIRSALNQEILLRRNPQLRSYTNTHTSVTDLASFVFCPVSMAIKMTYETIKSDEIYKSEELRSGKFLEEFLEAVRRKRDIDFLLTKMKLPNNTSRKIEFKRIVSDGKVIFRGINILCAPETPVVKDIEVTAEEYKSYVNRGDYGEILKSRIIFRGHEHDIMNPYFNENKTLSGIPDYIFENPMGQCFLLLEKHTWRDQTVTRPFPNHVVQALGYLIGLKSLSLFQGYILYLQNRNGARLYKINIDDLTRRIFQKTIQEVQSFKKSKSLLFDPHMINLDKCFRCSVRMYCYHKSGKLNVLTLPYNTA